MNALQATTGIMPETKSELTDFVAQIIRIVKSGDADPIEVAARMKYIEEVANRVRKGIEDNIIAEFDKYPEKEIIVKGVKFSKAQVGVKYDYSVCDDGIYNDLMQQQEELKAAIKERETFLKAVSGDVYGDDGIQIKRAVKTGKESFKTQIV